MIKFPQMSENLLATKFYPPALPPFFIQRNGLRDRIGSHGNLTIVSAPAGFGKTTAIIDAMDESGQSFAWLGLESEDNARVRFWRYFFGTLSRRFDIGGSNLIALETNNSLPVNSLLLSLINEISDTENNITVVLDDYHVLTNMEIHSDLWFLIEHAPPNFHIIISTREDPPFTLSRKRMHGTLSEIRADELRFNKDDIKRYLQNAVSIDMAEETVLKLLQKSEGWAAALQLIGLSLQRLDSGEQDKFISNFTGSHTYLVDYLVDEVLARQEKDIRDFLLSTSIFEKINGELCVSILDNPKAKELLYKIRDRNLFLVPLDSSGTWFRYHHLFRDFLRQRQREKGINHTELLRRAVEWFKEQDDYEQAIHYAIYSENWPTACKLLETYGFKILGREDHNQLVSWIESLPEKYRLSGNLLCILYSWALIYAGKIKQAEKCLDILSNPVNRESENNIGKEFSGYREAFLSVIEYQKGNIESCMFSGKEALALLPEAELSIRSRINSILGFSYHYMGNRKKAFGSIESARRLNEATGNLLEIGFAMSASVEILTDYGEIRKSKANIEEDIRIIRKVTGSDESPFLGYPYILLGVHYRDSFEMEEALEYIIRGIALSRKWIQKDSLTLGLVYLGEIYRILKEYHYAESAYREAAEAAKEVSPRMEDIVRGFQIRLELDSGNIIKAATWADNLNIDPANLPGFEHKTDINTWLLVRYSQKRFTEVSQLVSILIKQDEDSGRSGNLVFLYIVQAASLFQQGIEREASTYLEKALELAAADERRFLFLIIGIKDLHLRQYAGKYQSFVSGIIEAAIHKNSETALIESPEELNFRETQVLKLIAAGMSNKEIGEKLYLSVNTIRWYTSQIYSKIAVKSRGEAAAYAREQRIL